MDKNNSDCDENYVYKTTKKRKSHGRMSEVLKKLKLSSHESGPACGCRLGCFDKVPKESRTQILQNFNLLGSHDAQNSYLSGLISVLPVNRPSEKEGISHYDAVYKYRVLALIDSEVKEIMICKKAFMSIHGITRKKVEYLVASLKKTGCAAVDKRGKHNSHVKLNDDVKSLIRGHINSFKGRSSHYSLHDSNKTYLPEDLNVKKMHAMFLQDNQGVNVSYETYRNIFCSDFNIAFGYPRTDTCSICDEFIAKSKALDAQKKTCTDTIAKSTLDREILNLFNLNKIHKLQASTFYHRKRMARLRSREAGSSMEAICFDYGKNLCAPNIQTNDTYYKRQLSVFAFNVHVLSSSQSIFYLYPETEGKKGSDDVCSLVHHFIYNYMKPTTTHLQIFCDSCGGQNKNFTMFRFLHHLVHHEKRLEKITMTFPVRGHSYMECDKNIGLVKSKTRAELPSDWIDIFQNARCKPSPFEVIEVNKSYFRSWTSYLDTIYAKKSSFPSRPIKVLKIDKLSSKIGFRSTYNGAWESACISGRKKKTTEVNTVQHNEFTLPGRLYTDKLPISAEKYSDLQDLKKFCSPESITYYTNLPHK